MRHNLSINPHFRKGHKAPQGAGHLWTISSGDSAENVLAWEHVSNHTEFGIYHTNTHFAHFPLQKKQRLDLFFKMESMNRERLAQHQQQIQQQTTSSNARQQQHQSHSRHNGCPQDQQCHYDEAAVAAAAIQQEMMQQQGQSSCNAKESALLQRTTTIHTNNESIHHHQQTLHALPYNELLSEEELRKTAGQILNGIHREVEVQSVNHQSIISTYQDVLMDNGKYF